MQNYNVPGYFGDVGKGGKRWTYYRTRAEGHNTLAINPDSLEDQHVDANTRIVQFTQQTGKTFGIMDITDAYRGKVTSAERGVALINSSRANPGRVLVQDQIRSDAPTDVYWFSHTSAAVTLAPDGRRATLTKDGKTLTVNLVSPANARFTVMDARPLPGSPNPEGNTKNTGIQKLAVHLPGVTNATIAVEFSEAGAKKKWIVQPLSDW